MRRETTLLAALAMAFGLTVSAQALTWTKQTSNTTSRLYKAIWSGTQFVAVGRNGTVVTSPDGETWTVRTSNAGATTSLNDVVWSGSQFVAVGGPQLSATGAGVVVTSADGETWTPRTSNAAQSLTSVIWSDTQFVAVGSNGTIVTSPDGITWTARTYDIGETTHLSKVVYGTQFVAVGRAETGTRWGTEIIVTSADGATWTPRAYDSILPLTSVVWSGTQYVAVGGTPGTSGSVIVTSPDGITWTQRTDEAMGCQLLSIIWNGSQFVAVGSPEIIVTSLDGVTWSRRAYDPARALHSVAWSGAQFAAVGYGPWVTGELLLSSPDGVTWTEDASDAGETIVLNNVVWSGTRFIAAGNSGIILSTPSSTGPKVSITGPETIPTGRVEGEAIAMSAETNFPGEGSLGNWRVSDASLAEIDPDVGVIVGLQAGTVDVLVDYTLDDTTVTSPPFTLQIVDRPVTANKVSPDPQIVTPGQPLVFPLLVEVLDAAGGSPVEGIGVTFTITTQPPRSVASLSETGAVMTDASGLAGNDLTVDGAGLYEVVASTPALEGSPPVFTAAPVDLVRLQLGSYTPRILVDPGSKGKPIVLEVSPPEPAPPSTLTLTAIGYFKGANGKIDPIDAPVDDVELGPVLVDWVDVSGGAKNEAFLLGADEDGMVFGQTSAILSAGQKAGGSKLKVYHPVPDSKQKVTGTFSVQVDESAPPVATDQETEGGCGQEASCYVFFHNGEEHFDVVDLSVPGRGDIHFEWRRKYRSRTTYDGPLGHNWDFNYNDRLYAQADGSVTRSNGAGHVDSWLSLGDGMFQSPRGFLGTLIQLGDGTYVLREPCGFKRFYRADGRLSAHQDRRGNRMEFQYYEGGSLAKIVDAYGRVFDCVYELSDTGRPRLARVVDFADREVVYTYDENDDLVAARSPVVTGTSTGNDFPDGRTERYVYSSGHHDEELNHNILQRILPEEVANGGPPAIVCTYGTNRRKPDFDRVVALTCGGTNASGVPAGGEKTFSYALLNEDIPLGDPTVIRRQTVHTDRNGNITEYYFNERFDCIQKRTLTRGLHEGEPAAYVETSQYNADGNLVRRVLPEGDQILCTYDTGGPRAAHRNLVEIRRVAGPRGGVEDVVINKTYEPLFQRLGTVIGPRGNATSFTPPLGAASPERYTTTYLFDYQEGSGPIEEAITFGIDLSGIQRGLGDLNGDGQTDQTAGNVVFSQAPSVLLRADSKMAERLGSTTQTIVTQTQWNLRGQLTKEIDCEGNVTDFIHYAENDPDGDGTPVPGQTSTAPFGYLKSTIIDAEDSSRRTSTTPPVRLETVIAYDPVGNVTGTLDPRGVLTKIEVNQLNERVVTTRDADVSEAAASGQLITGEAAFQYRTRTFYDFNGRVVKTEVENRDGTDIGPGGVGAYVESVRSYDILGNLVETTVEVDASTTVTTRQRYDANQNLILVIQHEGNQVQTLYDERDLPYVTTRGAGTSDASTTRFDYDKNRNLVRVTDAEDNDGDGQPEVTTYVYDGFDRRVRAIDALGNETVNTYDPASNIVRLELYAHPAGQPGAPKVLFSDVKTSIDELNRAFQTDQTLFVPQGFAPARPLRLLDGNSDGLVTNWVEYDALGRTTFTIEDDGQVTQTVYDGASRPIETIDALGNRVQTTYDKNSNPLTVTEIEVAPEGLVPNEIFVTRNVYDQLNRLVRTTDNAGQTTRSQYDSRDNLVRQSDAEGPLMADPLGLYPGQINGPGNTRTFFFDGLSRNTRVVADLRVGGTGAGALDTSNPDNPDGQVSLTYLWDGNSRQTGIVDDNGNQTTFQYDALDRRIRQINAKTDEVTTWVFDRDDNIRQVTDPDGTVATKVYDALNRLTSVSVARAPGVGGTTSESFEYDGLGRMTKASDDNGGAPQVCEFVYDSLGRLLEERQNGQPVSNVYTGDGKRIQSTLPGGRVLQNTFDAIDRVKTISDSGGPITAADWIGPGLRELRRQNRNGTSLTFVESGSDVGYDAVKRITRLRVLGPSGEPVSRGYTYNRANMRTSEARFDDAGLTDSYTYDSTYRVIATAVDQGDGVKRDVQSLAYQYDGVGNRRKVDTVSQSAGAQSEAYTVNAVNEYTSKGGVSRSHSRNGNLTDDGTRTYVYDYKNRLVSVAEKATGDPVAVYLYYSDNRRARKVVSPGPSSTETRFFYDGWQVCEEQNAAGATLATYVYSPVYLDEPVQIQRTAAHPLGAGEVCAHQNARADVVAVTDASGAVVERRFYDDFGNAFDETKQPVLASAVGNPYGFQGRRLDAETGLYYFRNRYFSTETGRFLQRDPVWDAQNFGGQYSFAWNGPVSGMDALGLNPNLQCQPPMYLPGDIPMDTGGSGAPILLLPVIGEAIVEAAPYVCGGSILIAKGPEIVHGLGAGAAAVTDALRSRITPPELRPPTETFPVTSSLPPPPGYLPLPAEPLPGSPGYVPPVVILPTPGLVPPAVPELKPYGQELGPNVTILTMEAGEVEAGGSKPEEKFIPLVLPLAGGPRPSSGWEPIEQYVTRRVRQIQERVRMETRGHESGQSHKTRSAMVRELRKEARLARDDGFDIIADRFEEIAGTHEKKLKGLKHPGGRRGRGPRR